LEKTNFFAFMAVTIDVWNPVLTRVHSFHKWKFELINWICKSWLITVKPEVW
jgi:hypothetical protein